MKVMKDPRLSGYIASALVPHNANLGINEQEYVNHLKEISKAERLCAVYVNALVGQIYSLEPEERQRLITIAKQTIPKSIPSLGVISHIQTSFFIVLLLFIVLVVKFCKTPFLYHANVVPDSESPSSS